jgi:hypothetical protein
VGFVVVGLFDFTDVELVGTFVEVGSVVVGLVAVRDVEVAGTFEVGFVVVGFCLNRC